MASREAFVDVTYRGLDAGRRLKLTDLGPETGYLEMARPLPVGARLGLLTDEGCEIAAVVLRVHEQVAGADLAPGMRLRVVDATDDVVAWWSDRVTASDPRIPTPAPPPNAVPLPIATVGVPPEREPAAAQEKPEPDEAAGPDAAPESPPSAPVGDAPPDGAPADAGAEAVPDVPADAPADAGRKSAVASAKAEPASAPEPLAEAAENANSPPANGERKKRKRRRRR